MPLVTAAALAGKLLPIPVRADLGKALCREHQKHQHEADTGSLISIHFDHQNKWQTLHTSLNVGFAQKGIPLVAKLTSLCALWQLVHWTLLLLSKRTLGSDRISMTDLRGVSLALLAAMSEAVTSKDTGWDPERSVPMNPLALGGKAPRLLAPRPLPGGPPIAPSATVPS